MDEPRAPEPEDEDGPEPEDRDDDSGAAEEPPVMKKPGKGYRNTDPWTSKSAAEAFPTDRETIKRRVLRVYFWAGDEGLNDYEAGARAGVLRGCYWKRASELRLDDGFIVNTGTVRPGKFKNVPRMVCVITDDGKRFIEGRIREGREPAENPYLKQKKNGLAWLTIRSEDLLIALQRVHEGEDPDAVHAELQKEYEKDDE